jgi:uncharacterized protein (TIGR02246 family)
MALLTIAGDDDERVRELYLELLDCWNRRSAVAIASLIDERGVLIGFDGSTYVGPSHVETELQRIFADHQTGTFVGKVRDVWFPSPQIAMLRGAAGMVPPGETDIKPELTAVQSLVAIRADQSWRVALFQNTPAALHGRPEVSERLTQELRDELRRSREDYPGRLR